MKIPDGSVGEIAPADWLSAVSPLEYPVLMRSMQNCHCRIRQKTASLKPFKIAFRGHSNWPDYADHPRLDYADP
ncbi:MULTISPECIES: hypothetical protein [Burkholderiaceae]|uniref:hypothetical protein n=1 Tax=Burkholderiaceae TaxID=119060 RepID=UPI0011156134|nr:MULTISPECIES: hypothetical protein [Burkholderiaceae]MCG1040636.1 hypothetical protein [Mycetohabitans sp. B7]MCG1041000.1 hypothetical protein [Mycetohabitans sp. B7]